MLLNPKALFYVVLKINNLNSGHSNAGTTSSPSVSFFVLFYVVLFCFDLFCFVFWPPSSLTLFVFYEAAGTRRCFLLATSLVFQRHSAVLLQSRTCDWTWHGGVAMGDVP